VPQWDDFALEQSDQSGGHCECCGKETVRVNGNVIDGETFVALYTVVWTKGVRSHGAEFSFIFGAWGEGTTLKDRSVVLLDFNCSEENGFGFRIADDVLQRRGNLEEFASNFLDRGALIGSAFTPFLFAVADAVYMKEMRLDEIRAWAE